MDLMQAALRDPFTGIERRATLCRLAEFVSPRH